MSEIEANGARLYYELHGNRDPLALVHGSWGDATGWAFVLPHLAESFRVLVYDRRGHSRSERPDTPGSLDEDGDDLAALLVAFEMVPAHVVTNSLGGIVALRLAARRPDLFRSLYCHEPPLWGLLEDDAGSQELLREGQRSVEVIARRIAEGDHEGAARQFAEEIAFGPGAWEEELPPEVRAIMTQNAPTFLDELQDPNLLMIEGDVLARIAVPVHLSDGTDSPPTFGRVVDRLVELIPGATREKIEGTGHVPHMTTPDRYVEATMGAVQRTAA
jgi:pimeloyl-ACP methyl ester carboxylesterase